MLGPCSAHSWGCSLLCFARPAGIRHRCGGYWSQNHLGTRTPLPYRPFVHLTHSFTHAHIYTSTYTRANIHANTRKLHIHPRAHTCTHARIHTHTRTHTCKHLPSLVHTQVRVHSRSLRVRHSRTHEYEPPTRSHFTNQSHSLFLKELHLPPDRKTIHPLRSGDGGRLGIAGGQKYLQEGIFFKFATDLLGICMCSQTW
jgi:hypothetical protein